MKILQVGSSLFDWGGIERYVAYLQGGLTERCHEVDVTCPPGSPLDKRVANQINISVRRKHDLRALSQYLKLFRQRPYDLVHIHFNPDFLVAGTAARMRKMRFTVLTRHVALPWSKGKVKMYGGLFDHIIPVSNAVERQLANSGIPREKMTVAKAGCAPLIADSPKPLDGDFKVGCFGRLTPEKGVEVLLDALALSPGVTGHIFGEGPSAASLQARGVANARFHGFVTGVADYMASVDAVVIPSQWEEAFPYAALEAMSLAKPLIVSRTGGMPEIVVEGENGLIFEKTSAKELASHFFSLAADRDQTIAMGRRGQEMHRSEYTIEKMAERIEAVYLANRR